MSCQVYARVYPVHLLHKSFAVQFYGADSIYEQLNQKDTTQALNEIKQLEEWAENNGDDHLKNAFVLREYILCLFNFRGYEKTKAENGLPQFINELGKNKMPELEAEALDLLADVYWKTPKNYSEAYQASLEAYNIYSKFSDQEFPPKYSILYNHGLGYYRFKDYTNALIIFWEARRIRRPAYKNPAGYDLFNTMGLCFRRSGVYDSAEQYFREAYEFAKADNKEVWVGIIGGNLGITYYLQKRYKEAIPLIEYDIKTGLGHNKLNDNAANSIAILGDIYLELNDKRKGLELLLQAYQVVIDGNRWKNYELTGTIYTLLAKAYAANGNYQLAYNYADSARSASDSSAAQKNALILGGVQQKINLEKHLAEVQQHEREYKIQVLIWVFMLVSITFLLVAVFSILRNYKNQKKTNKLLSIEKKRSEDLLLNILPTEVADELKDKGSAEAKHFDHVTVMFTDFVNFTQASEKMNPQQLIDELHACFKAFDEIIGKYNIEKIKTIGDAYLAVSGLPVADPLHAEHVVGAALEINDFMSHRIRHINEETFSLRIGIHTGSVVAGIVGVMKFSYDIWGDAVNIAARMEQNSEPGKINISQTTYDLIKDKYNCAYRGEIEAKNKGKMGMYFVTGRK